jgi:hypothetical protein
VAGVGDDSEAIEPLLLDDELFVIGSRAQRAGARAVRTQSVSAALPVLLLASLIVISVIWIWVDPT